MRSAEAVLAAFDNLSPSEQYEVALQILRRSVTSDERSDLPLDELAANVFRGYDAEEAADAGGSAR